MRSLLVGLVVQVALATAALAQPKPSPAFTREYQAGIDAFRLGKYDAARGHLATARDLQPSLPGPHRFLAAVAAAEQKWEECILSARSAIEANPLSSEIGATRKLHDDCRTALGLPAFADMVEGGGAIHVNANVGGATVTIAGLKYGATPLAPRAIAAGEVEVLVQKAGWKEARVTAKVLPGVVTDVALTLEEVAAVAGEGAVGTEPPPVADIGWIVVTAPPGAQVAVDGALATVDERGRYVLRPGDHQLDLTAPGRYPARRVVRVSRGQEITVVVDMIATGAIDRRRRIGRVAILSAVGLGAVGAVTGLLAGRAEDDARDLWAIERARPPTSTLAETGAVVPVRTRADIQERVDRARQLGLVSNVGFGLAAAAFGVGVYMLARTPEVPRSPTLSPIVPIGGDAWGLAVGGTL